MKELKVTVLMSVYNGEKYLGEAIDSILNQTFTDFEFLIINDGSTDKTQDILNSYKDPRIKIINNKENIGLTKSLNKGLKLARGEYIARQDADDISLPERLEKEAKFLDEHIDYGLVGAHYLMINEKGKVIKNIECLTDSNILKEKLFEGNQFGHGSIMIRKKSIENIGGYRKEFRYAQDYDLYLRAVGVFEIENIPEMLYKWRFNPKSASVTNKALQDKYALLAVEMAKERKEKGKDRLQHLSEKKKKIFLEDFLSFETEKNYKEEISENYYFWSNILFKGRDFGGAIKLAFKGFLNNPSNIRGWASTFKNIIVFTLPKPIIDFLRRIKKIALT